MKGENVMEGNRKDTKNNKKEAIGLRQRVTSSFRIKYPKFNKEKFLDIVANGSLKEVRHLATALDSYTYDECDTDERNEVRDALNNKVNQLLGDELTNLFNQLVKSQRHELWCGDERFRMLDMDEPPYYVRSVLKSMIYLKFEYLGKELTVDNIKEASNLYEHSIHWELVVPLRKDPLWSSKYTDAFSKYRQQEIAKWVEFDGYILRGELEKAYQILVRYREEYKKSFGRDTR